MRPPRYRFPDQVRSATREMAARMAREGSVVETPEELDAWIAREPDTRAALEGGGYGTQFTADDLLPLLHVMVGAAGGRVPSAEPPPRPARPRRLWIALLLVALLVAIAVALAVARRGG